MSPLEWNTPPLSTTYNNNSNNPNGPTHPGARASVVPHRWDSGFSVNNTHTYKAVWNSMRSHSLLLSFFSLFPLACVCVFPYNGRWRCAGADHDACQMTLRTHTHTLWQLAASITSQRRTRISFATPYQIVNLTWELRRWRGSARIIQIATKDL